MQRGAHWREEKFNGKKQQLEERWYPTQTLQQIWLSVCLQAYVVYVYDSRVTGCR